MVELEKGRINLNSKLDGMVPLITDSLVMAVFLGVLFRNQARI
ncbi:hypothetical protein DSBG_0250 [Desulfosporosinus sp. BG]|nr:hypothetical protein DSBG_0250 [Desulfosporosinus sp. BG]